MKAIVQNIKYDTDNENVSLPETLTINLPINIVDDIEEMEEYIADKISDETGFCHYSFTYYLQNY
jgi:hypothetical protein